MQLHNHYMYNWAPIAEFKNVEFNSRWEEKIYRLSDIQTDYDGDKNVSSQKSGDALLTSKVRIFLQDTQFSSLPAELRAQIQNGEV